MSDSFYWRIRHSLARIHFLRSGYYLLRSIREALADSPAQGQAELNREFESHEDPWNYATAPDQLERIGSEVMMLEAARGGEPFGNGLEIGCAEGLFTEQLAPLCQSLLAVDISPIALERARRRIGARANVRFLHWDLRVDPVPLTCDLIVIVHALEYVRNPLHMLRARRKLVKSLRPGGLLLIGTMKVAQVYEDAWWGRFLLRSGMRINHFFASHPALKVIQTKEFHLGKEYVAYDVLLRKKF